MRKDEYIREVVSRIENKKARAEVEKELSNHIDDRISYYTDAGWDEETANIKAMEHMGEPEKAAVSLARIHMGSGRVIFIILMVSFGVLALLNAFGVLVNHGIALNLINIFLNDPFITIFGEDTVNKLWFADTMLLIGILTLTTAFGYLRRKIWCLFIALSCELYMSLCGIAYVIYSNAGIVLFSSADFFFEDLLGSILVDLFFLLPTVFLVFTFILLETVRKSNAYLKGEEYERRRGINFLISLAGAVGIVMISITVLFIADFASIAREYDNHAVIEEYFNEYIDRNLPTETANVKESAAIDIYTYNNRGAAYNHDDYSREGWRIKTAVANSEIKPVKRLLVEPDRDWDSYDVQAYYITNCDGILLKYGCSLETDDYIDPDITDDSADGFDRYIYFDYLISDDYKYPEFENAKVTHMTAFGIDFASAFTDRESETLRSLINVQDFDHVNKLGYDIKFDKIEWEFEGCELFSNSFAYLVESDGKFYITNEMHRDSNGKGQYSSYGNMLELNEDIVKNIEEIIKNNKEKYDSFKSNPK